MKVLQKASSFIIGGLERIFYRWGRFVSLHPYPVIIVSILFTVLSGLGFLNFRQEHRANLLWIPPWSDYNVNAKWLENNFKNNRREEIVIYNADNILTPEHIQKMFVMHQKIAAVNINGKTFNDICTKIPLGNIFHTDKRRKKRETLAINPPVVRSGNQQEPDADQTIPNTVAQDIVENEDGDTFSPDEGGLWIDYDYDYDYEYDEADNGKEQAEHFGELHVPRIDFEAYGKLKDENGKSLLKGVSDLPEDIKCGIANTLKEKCLESNLLEIWKFKEDLVNTTTQQEIIDAVNLLERSPWTSHKTDFISHLGGIERNSTGHVVSAKAARLYWNVVVPEDAVLVANTRSGVDVNLADQDTLDWEQRLIDITLNTSEPGVRAVPKAIKSFGDLSQEAIFVDAIKMAAGFLIMFLYTFVMLGKMNTLELKLYLSIVGILSIGMGLVIGLGLASVLGYPYTPMHGCLPFLGLGIGIDDMFVIVQCFFNMKRAQKLNLEVDEEIGLALKHAGVSVTITTLTDVFAFGVGAATRMPGLESFCVTCAIALAAIFLLQISWFTAFLSIDEKRIRGGRDGLIPCYVHKKLTPPSWSSSALMTKLMSIIKKLLPSRLYKAMIVVASLIFLGFGSWGSVLIKQKFDPALILTKDSYLREWIDLSLEYYPSKGWGAHVYTSKIDYRSLAALDKLEADLQQLVDKKNYYRDMSMWWTELKVFARENKNYSTWQDFANPDDFPRILTNFLFSGDGSRFKIDFKFEGELDCEKPAPPIVASRFAIGFVVLDGPQNHLPAKRILKDVVSNSGVSDVAFVLSEVYPAWETDEIIGTELWRNIGLAMMAVAIVTLILLANIQVCLLVLTCVILTLTNIVGYLHFWGMTIDIISCVSIVLAIGLCVDYSVHVAHAYLIGQGSRVDKAVSALETIGPAVFNGGFTTFLALVLLAFSQSQIFITFFKVFFLTVVFGLFHGLVLLPVLLSILGPLSPGLESPINGTDHPPQNKTDRVAHTNLAFIQEKELSIISSKKPKLVEKFEKKKSQQSG